MTGETRKITTPTADKKNFVLIVVQFKRHGSCFHV